MIHVTRVRRQLVLACVAVLALCGLLTACGFAELDRRFMKPTMTEEQAAQRAEEHIRRAVSVLPPTARLENPFFNTMPCADATVPGPEGRVSVARTYWLRGLPKENNRAYFDTLYEFWTRNGYRVLSDDRANRESMYLWVEHTGDSFRLSIQSNDYGDLSIGADSPCIWPKGTPEPEEP
ncbi:hypothetical protein LI90_514 [Carbonactinospora thermoautotrophica]|uniref:Lipoprotein n=1 Tax=Carbonactinospora thermoautotrophica TaxID=1469144 RepID=A0A132MLZ5_9ACTN|nr:hypothetical protein [Carbonactinospora thermoautotrophica]KWW98884.1 hypothetical protein LI90_514 [Carbonactinospora thermoautotrophica]